MATRTGNASDYVMGLELPPAAPTRGGTRGDAALAALESTREQAAVVGSDIVAFAASVQSELRKDLADSTLLAQLVANKAVPDRARMFDWYDTYFDTLANIGWAVQDRDFSIYVSETENFEAHKAIIEVATALMGPATSTLALVTTTLKALQSMQDDSPWLTLFAREAQSAETARFQVSAVEVANGEPFVSLMAFGLQAHSKMTQVLFFRARSNDVTLRHCGGKLSIDAVVLDEVRDALRQKLATHANDFIKALPVL